MSELSGLRKPGQGYIYNTFGDVQYLRYAVTSVYTLRRYDQDRPVVLVCDKHHKEILLKESLDHLFSEIIVLTDENSSITGFKHNLHYFMPFEENLFLDSDIVWCKNPDKLWESFGPYDFTITGNKIADLFFGGPKGLGIIFDFVFRRRNQTLKNFGLTYLSRVQSGMIYSSDREITESVCTIAAEMKKNQHETHFRSRTIEKGRLQESCEWSLSMAMAKLRLQVYPWLNGYDSPQLDFIEDYTNYDEEFKQVECLVYNDRYVYDLKGIRWRWFRSLFISFMSILPGKGDHLYTTPYCLHFGWYHQKEPLKKFSQKVWSELKSRSVPVHQE